MFDDDGKNEYDGTNKISSIICISICILDYNSLEQIRIFLVYLASSVTTTRVLATTPGTSFAYIVRQS